ncbi:VOC family protein [Sphingobacterium sp. DK4209]|uniref:VOC family protein n=1 Tax=Sphingobacterium zhuxiongii TaxID=2662364 RepID=A0A5Q0Q6G1_9SPHI|nr:MULTISPECIES: VOC family protein [unclassified Sphingobacterium]MVZ67316.1 VOC family protein [Sphingobacterium sp. DK4209]QGA25053.1 VOC family protein [Sphingobacterium sp. dk4302]
MLGLTGVHHIAIICSDYQRSKQFYTEVLGLGILREVFRETRNSYKLDLSLNGEYIIELFSFPNPPARPSFPEALGLRHLAFSVLDIKAERDRLLNLGIAVEEIRIDEITEKRFTFFSDPDGLPIELYET